MEEKDFLTRKQKLLIRELNEIVEILGVNYQNVQNIDKEIRTSGLEMIKSQVIRGGIVMEYVTIDELLNDIILNYFFGVRKSYIYLWKTKKFRNFNYCILEELSLLKKLALIK